MEELVEELGSWFCWIEKVVSGNVISLVHQNRFQWFNLEQIGGMKPDDCTAIASSKRKHIRMETHKKVIRNMHFKHGSSAYTVGHILWWYEY